MLLLLIILIGVCTLSGAVAVWMELSIINNTLTWLEERLDKLQKDAVKVTFDEPTQSTHTKEILLENRKIKPVKRKPKTTKDWEDEFDLGGHE